MEGVNILSQTTTTESVMNMTTFWIAFWIVTTIISVCIIWAIINSGEPIFALWFIVVPLIATFIGIMFGELSGSTVETGTVYKVTIDESVSMTEFYDKYEVLDQEGLIFTVKEK